MKIQRYLGMLGFVLMYHVTSSAQTCGMYTYQDVYTNADGTVVGENYTQAQCARTSAYAEVVVRMPSGAHWIASASGVVSAEALAPSAISGESGTGTFSGYNEISMDCWDYQSAGSFNWPIYIDGAYTKEVWIGGQIGNSCAVTASCNNTTTPQCYSAQIYLTGSGQSCSPAYNNYFLTYRIGSGSVHCVTPGISTPTSDTNPEWCTPHQ